MDGGGYGRIERRFHIPISYVQEFNVLMNLELT